MPVNVADRASSRDADRPGPRQTFPRSAEAPPACASSGPLLPPGVRRTSGRSQPSGCTPDTALLLPATQVPDNRGIVRVPSLLELEHVEGFVLHGHLSHEEAWHVLCQALGEWANSRGVDLDRPRRAIKDQSGTGAPGGQHDPTG